MFIFQKKMLIQIINGLLSYTPLHKYKSRGTGGTNSARYCYSVWLRHLSLAFEHGFTTVPKVVAELGPGDSLGIGLAALISGADKLYALDVVKYSNIKINMEIFKELVELFKARKNIPDDLEFPEIRPLLKSYKFPDHILPEEYINTRLNPGRIRCLEESLIRCESDPVCNGKYLIKYVVPWDDPTIIDEESIDMIYSQAVMEHVEELKDTYHCLYLWLRQSGLMSHQVDFKCHESADFWNGHWAYADFIWKLIKGKKTYYINRLPFSHHITTQKKIGFKIINSIREPNYEGIQRKHVTQKFKNFTDIDLVTCTAHILSTKN